MKLRFAFFGGEPLGVPTLEALARNNLVPSLIVSNPDRPAGRGQQLTAPPVKEWALAHNIPVWQPTTLDPAAVEIAGDWDLFVVVAYNKILPQWLIKLPKHHTINVHPSLLPKLRGASPIRSAILRDEPDNVGITIMHMDEKMDHGPIIAQRPMPIAPQDWPIPGPALDDALAHMGGELLASTIPEYVAGTRTPYAQDHTEATYCGRLDKSMAELTIDPYDLPTGAAAHAAYRTFLAFLGIGNAWFMYQGTRYKITNAHLAGERLVIDTVIPAGKAEKAFRDSF